MKIAQKLMLMAIAAVIMMLVVGGTGLFVANRLEDALDNVNTRGTPGMRNVVNGGAIGNRKAE